MARHRLAKMRLLRLPVSIGITGGIGSGKSAVASELTRLGFPILAADEIAKAISDSDPVVRRQLIRLLGKEAYRSNGRMNRLIVARRIFTNKRLKRKVERVIHPRVLREVDRRLRALGRRGCRLAFVEAALIYESGMDRKLSAVIVVDAPASLRLKRVTGRDKASAAEIRRRMAGQMDPQEMRRRADIVLENKRTLPALRRNVRFLASVLQSFVCEA